MTRCATVCFEPIRQYAREKLEEGGESETVLRRHADYFLALAEEARPGLRGPEVGEWSGRLETEHDNMRAALSFALESEEAGLALRLAAALGTFWYMHSHSDEGRKWLEAALARDKGAPAALRISALERGTGWPSISGTTTGLMRWPGRPTSSAQE